MFEKVFDQDLNKFHYAIVVLASVSGFIHVYLGFQAGLDSLYSFLMVAAGLGFAAGILMILKGFKNSKLYLTGVLFTSTQIVLWLNWSRPDLSLIIRGEPFIHALDKFVQSALIIILLYLYIEER